MQTGEKTAPGKGREALSLSHPPGSAVSLLCKADVLPISASFLYTGAWGCFIYRELKLDLEKQFWIHLGVRVYR